MLEKDRYSKLVDLLADKRVRNQAIVDLVGAINGRDLAVATLTPGARTALIEGLEHDSSVVRWWCLQLMDHLADDSFVPHILPLLRDPVPRVRRHAVHALTCEICKPDRCGLELSESIRQSIVELAENDPNQKVRAEARRGLATWND